MDAMLSFLAEHRTGLLVFFLSLAGLALLTQWFAWIFNLGRFKRTNDAKTADTARKSSLRFIVADLMVKIIDDFRHLLALIVVLIFAFALGVGMYIGSASIENLTKALQAVMATLGGLVGSIIGYYFGESTVLKQQENPPPSATASTITNQEQSTETPADASDITEAPPPPVDNPDADVDDGDTT